MLLVTTGVTVATCTAVPLLILSVRHDGGQAAGGGRPVGGEFTVSEVAVAAVTVPTAPSLKATVLLAAVVSKPKPLMVIVVALAARLAVLLVTTGVTVATCTGRAAADAVGGHHGGQAADGGRLGGEGHGERGRGGRGDGADRPVVEGRPCCWRPSYRSRSR